MLLLQVVPIDERCDGNNFWKTKGKSCARHSAKAVELKGHFEFFHGNGKIYLTTIYIYAVYF